METDYTLTQRTLGSYLGFAIGDALGATVEFMTAREIAAVHRVHQNITGGGWLKLVAGRVTDDTELCLATGDALLLRGPDPLRDIADSYVRWMRSCPPDIGNTCRRGIRRYMLEGTLSAPESADNAGNGAAMRNLPVVIATLRDENAFEALTLGQAHITHNHPLSDAATLALGRMTRRLLRGAAIEAAREEARSLVAEASTFRFSPWPGRTSGYIVDTVQTALDAFFTTSGFESCLVKAVNQGGDADTIGALAGQLAGACYGIESIPDRWMRRLDPKVTTKIRAQTASLLDLASARRVNGYEPFHPPPLRLSPLQRALPL